MNLRLTGESAYFYVREPEAGQHAPERARILTAGGTVLTRRPRDYAARLEVVDETGRGLHPGVLLRAAAAVARPLEARGQGLAEALRVRLVLPDALERSPASDPTAVMLDGLALAAAPMHHQAEAQGREAVARFLAARAAAGTAPVRVTQSLLPEHRARRVLFFESLMNTDMPHNDTELSQGVLHMASALQETGAEVVFANVKMPITGAHRPIAGLDTVKLALERGPVDLVCITLLEGYFEGVVRLIGELRSLGCTAHIAVGGVMPTLAPEHVAAHLQDVTFVCRGAGEYHLPQLVHLVGQRGFQEPLDQAQRDALAAMDGIFAVDRAGGALIAGNPGRTVKVEDLDRVALDLRFLKAHHLERGVELSTSRGCIHKCAFCSIIGRQSYQARSAGGVLELLGRYEARYAELFGDEIPRNAFRVHLSDDDFACDRERARTFFVELLQTPFRLASAQVSVADLCRRDGNTLLPEIDYELVDAIRPECFADSSASFPERDFVADHKSRRWSSYLQIGVETFADAELARLGKGYDVAHIRAVVHELATRRIHMDAYLILANAETSLGDLVDSIEELSRLKLRYPHWFHVRFPIVPRLVSYFTSASYRRMLKKGQGNALTLRGHARVPGLPEYDYPFVEADEPLDDWVREIDPALFTDAGFYTGTLTAIAERLHQLWQERPATRSRERERILRRLDDRPRRLVFDLLSQARAGARPGALTRAAVPPDEQATLATAIAALGPAEAWLPAFRRYAATAVARLALPANAASTSTAASSSSLLERGIDLLFSTDREAVALDFLSAAQGPDPVFLRQAVDLAEAAAAQTGKRLSCCLHLGSATPDEAVLALLRERRLSLSLRLLPGSSEKLKPGFVRLAALGVARIGLECAPGSTWSTAELKQLGEALFEVGRELRQRPASTGERRSGPTLELEPAVTSARLVLASDGALRRDDVRDAAEPGKLVGHLDQLYCFDHYFMDETTDTTQTAAKGVRQVLESFQRWLAEPLSEELSL